MLQKKDPKLCSHIFHNQPQYDEHHDSSPVLVSKYHRWDCSRCLDSVEVSGHRPTSENVSMQQNGMNDGCSISIVWILPNSVDSRRLFSCTQQSSQGNDRLTLSKTAQECNSKCSSPGNKAITAMNVPVAEENVPEALVDTRVPSIEGMAEHVEFLIITFCCIQQANMTIFSQFYRPLPIVLICQQIS